MHFLESLQPKVADYFVYMVSNFVRILCTDRVTLDVLRFLSCPEVEPGQMNSENRLSSSSLVDWRYSGWPTSCANQNILVCHAGQKWFKSGPKSVPKMV